MTKGDKRRNRRKYRVRYDRIVIMTLIIAVIAVLASSCCKWMWGDKEKKDNNKNQSSQAGESQQETTTEPTTVPVLEEQPTTVPEERPLSGYELTKIDKSQMYKGDLVLVNADHEYTFPEGDIDPIPVYQNQNDYYSYGDMATSLDRIALTWLNEMMANYAGDNGLYNTGIFVQDGYRTFDEQKIRHSSGRSKTFDAGFTDYHTGRTIDLFYMNSESSSGYSYFSAEGAYEWFAENTGRFGFILRYPEGKKDQTGENPRTYTYRYVGAPHAYYINSNGLCLEEYIDKLRSHTNDKPLEIAVNGHSYSVYYVKAEGDQTDVPVPTGKDYVISGNNADGFIITVTNS